MGALDDLLGAPLAYFVALDRARRAYGAWLDQLGYGPQRTPSRILWTGPNARLLAYDTSAAGPALLIVPAPIKRAYIWDLTPEASVVRRGLAAGLRLYMLEWFDAEGPARNFGLYDHIAQAIIPALDVMAAAGTEGPAILAGHSLGGTLAAIAAALHPDRVAGLVLIEAPLRFGEHGGALAELVAATPPSSVAALARTLVPGSLLNLAAVAAAPDVFLAEPALDRLASAGDRASAAIHWRIERWMRDELAMPGPLLVDIVEGLYREDRFARGDLSLGGGKADPAALDAIPVLAVVEPQSRVVPPQSVIGLFELWPPKELRVLHYGGDRGVALQHVGALVGQNAHRRLWPEILAWIGAQRS